MISELGIDIAISIFGLALNAFWKRALQIFLHLTCEYSYNGENDQRGWLTYQSDIAPKNATPTRKPAMKTEEAVGTSGWRSHTRFHCQHRETELLHMANKRKGMGTFQASLSIQKGNLSQLTC